MTDNIRSIFSNLPEHLPDELCQTLWAKENIRIERILSQGHSTDWYDQTQDEWVLLLQGQARLLIENQPEITLHAGDYLLLPAHCRHRVTWTTPDEMSIWLAIHVNQTEQS